MKRKRLPYILSFLLLLILACNLLQGSGEEEGEGQSEGPTGIPLPNIVRETAGIEITGDTYYLAGGDCDDAGDGTRELPFCTFETAKKALGPGDGLILLSGRYTQRMEVEGLRGESEAPIVIMGEQPGSVIFDGGCSEMPCELSSVEWAWDEEAGLISILDSAHLVLADITVQNSIAAGVNVFSSQDITLANLTVHDTSHVGILLREVSKLQVLNNDVSRVTMGYWDEGGNLQVGTHESISVLRSDDFLVAGNYVHDSPKEGIDIKESSRNGEVRDNFVERTCHVGIYINEAFQVRVHHNHIRRSGYYLDEGREQLCESYPHFGRLMGRYYGGGIQLAVGDLGELSQGRLSDIQIDHNLIWDLYGTGIEFWDELRESQRGRGEMTGNLVANNVVYNTSLSAMIISDVTDTVIANNILAFSGEDPLYGNTLQDNHISHNLFLFESGEGDSLGDSPLLADPMFLDPANGDFSLRQGSPAIDAGLDVGLPFSGEAPDIGALEFGESGAAPGSTVDIWQPRPGTTWQWQLTGLPIDSSFDVDAYDIELFDNEADVVADLHTQGRRVICYISVGSWEDWRPDKTRFPPEVIGRNYEGWPGEKWLDIRQIDALAAVLSARLDQCRQKGFDAVEPDNIDGYTNNTGFPLTEADQSRFNRWLAEQAHQRGLSIGLKNDPDQAAELEPYFDWALTEDCFAQGWCEQMLPFIEAGKAVFAAEYTDTGVTLEEMCPQVKELGFSLILKHRELDAYLATCP